MEGRLASGYQEFSPPPPLSPYVECLWVQQIGDVDGVFTQPVLPDGCVDIVAPDDKLFVAGPATQTSNVELAPGAVTVGVRFRTGAAPPLVGVSAAELRDADYALDEVWGRAGTTLTNRLGDADLWSARLGVLVDALMDRVGRARTIDHVGVGVADLLHDDPNRSLAELATEVGLSERQLRRRVEDAVGYPPRTLARILRFQLFLRMARAAGIGRHLALLSAQAGYADQAHLTRESRELTGLPPAALLRWEANRLGL